MPLRVPGLLYILAHGWGPHAGCLGFFGSHLLALEHLVNLQVNCLLRSLLPRKGRLVVW